MVKPDQQNDVEKNSVYNNPKKYNSETSNSIGIMQSTPLHLMLHKNGTYLESLTQNGLDNQPVHDDDTVTKIAISFKRNITRKKVEGNSYVYSYKNKKQGGTGKGKWSKFLDGKYIYDNQVTLDNKDPLCDEFSKEDKYFILSSTGDHKSRMLSTACNSMTNDIIYGPLLTLSEFKIRVSISIMEYFDSGDADEVVRSIQESKCKFFHPEVVKRAISLSLDKGPRERELTSRLLTCLHPCPLTNSDIESGFEIILDSSEDLCIDIPDAKSVVGCFLARAIVDEVLPPAFISNRSSSHPGHEVVEKSIILLSQEHCTARLEKVWGPGDGRSVVELKEFIDQLIEEYLLSRELDEAARCVREMNAPHFHHELLKRSVKIAMEKDGLNHSELYASSLDAIATLFSFLVRNAIVSEYEVSKGITRLHKILPDLKLDVPAAPAMLDEFEAMAQESGCLISSLN